MKNEKEIWLDTEEIKQLLEGGLYWNDIESKFSDHKRHSIQRPLDQDASLDIDIEEKAQLMKEYDEEDVRAILLGEVKDLDQLNDPLLKGNASVVADRQINLSHVEEELEHPFFAESASAEEEKRIQTGNNEIEESSETQIFRNELFPNEEKDSEFKEMIFSNEIGSEEGPSFGGKKLIVILIVVGIITFGFWYYFLSR
ncbi:MAG: hypothetical protein AWM53_01523 [Candidatus Dichloromethanomonas elyunquensis]|nr:MAG: hypothetical protein AWM53_01523 [Candidatus Dichloromethanomonas elyunquensis]